MGVMRMPYFKSNESDAYERYENDAETEEEYDDGFDDPEDQEVPQLTKEEKEERNRSRLKLAFGAGNLFGVIAGTVLILILLALIFSMIHFVITDMGRNFSLFETKF